MSKAKILILGGLRKDSLTDLEKECDVTVGPAGHRLHDDREWVLDHIADYDGVIVAKMAFDKKMIDAAKKMDFVAAAQYRDEMLKLEDIKQHANR